MIRRLFTIASALSLVTGVAMLTLWARSMSTCDRILRVSKWTFVDAISLRGCVHVQLVIANQQIPLLPTWDWQSVAAKNAKIKNYPGWRLAGFGGSCGTIPVTNGTATS